MFFSALKMFLSQKLSFKLLNVCSRLYFILANKWTENNLNLKWLFPNLFIAAIQILWNYFKFINFKSYILKLILIKRCKKFQMAHMPKTGACTYLNYSTLNFFLILTWTLASINFKLTFFSINRKFLVFILPYFKYQEV